VGRTCSPHSFGEEIISYPCRDSNLGPNDDDDEEEEEEEEEDDNNLIYLRTLLKETQIFNS
jgi:hypothetical protein